MQVELIVSLTQLGAFVGALATGKLSDLYGRKSMILIADVMFTAGAVIMMIAPTPAILMIGRVIVGLGVGVASMLVPVYLSELSPDQIRGTVVAFDIMILCFGQFISSVISWTLGHKWRLMLGLAGVPSALQFLFMLFMPESARWLAKTGKHDKCMAVLNRIYLPNHVEEQYKILMKEIEERKEDDKLTDTEKMKELFTTYQSCLLVGCALQFFQQSIGINTIMYYGPAIILGTGIKINGYEPKDPQIGVVLNIPLALVSAVGTILTTVYSDKFGRRYIMLRTIPFIFSSCLLVSLSFYMTIYGEEDSTMKNAGEWLALVGLFFYLIFFQAGMSGIVWSVCAEIFPIHLVGIATSLTTATNWLSNFAISSVFLTIVSTDLGKILAFLILAFFNIWAICFIYRRVPETKGKAIHENVEAILNYKRKLDQLKMEIK